MKQLQHYPGWVAFSAAMLVISAAVLNVIANPYWIFRWTARDLFPYKPEIYSHTRLFKAYAILDEKPRAVVLGSSRAQLGIDANHPGFRSRPVFNYSIWAVNAYELRAFFEHAANATDLAQAVIGLDWFYFNMIRAPAKDFDERTLMSRERGSPMNRAMFVVSVDTLRSSLRTIWHLGDTVYAFDPKTGQPTTASIRAQKVSEAISLGGMRGIFAFNTGDVLRTMWGPEFSFEDRSGKANSLEEFRTIVRIAYDKNIDLRMFISPTHAWLSEAMYESGRGEVWELWKRELVRITEEEAARTGKPPFPIWDFSGYNSITSETVPASGDVRTDMQWYWECSHYKMELGDLVLDRVLAYHEATRGSPRDFGVRITTSNISDHLEQIRLDRQHYRRTHSEDVQEIERIVLEANVNLSETAKAAIGSRAMPPQPALGGPR